QSSLPLSQFKTGKQLDESPVECSPMPSSKHDQQTLHSCPPDENNPRLFNSDHLSEASSNLRHSIATSNPTLGKTVRSIGSSNSSSTLLGYGRSANNRTDAGAGKYQGGDEMTESKAATAETTQADDSILGYRTSSERNDLGSHSLQLMSKPALLTSKSYDATTRHGLIPPNTPPSTPEKSPKVKPRLHAVASDLSTSKENNDSHRSSISSHPSSMEQQENKTETTIISSHIPQRSSYDQQTLESSSSNQDYHRSQEAVIRQKQSTIYEDQPHKKAKTSNLSSRSVIKSSNRDDPIVAYIPSLPSSDFNNKELELMI
ncbi:unnamed protein product, partial [Rotaria sp. Silwood2]